MHINGDGNDILTDYKIIMSSKTERIIIVVFNDTFIRACVNKSKVCNTYRPSFDLNLMRNSETKHFPVSSICYISQIVSKHRKASQVLRNIRQMSIQLQ